ncbi:hypothetical protein IE53DRAFT_369725 [Violaceomyces palustris]|uniref:Uncharacterized protein n=1 Tax=Violaceomyces palustris TaxID=1673888 RepID=A0ACD0NUJ2_9BASI|nr:hypothetical protein IE53DRAFT_369725 [Violaceomyces palustris]
MMMAAEHRSPVSNPTSSSFPEASLSRDLGTSPSRRGDPSASSSSPPPSSSSAARQSQPQVQHRSTAPAPSATKSSSSQSTSSPNHSAAHQLEALSPYSTLSCQSTATKVWRADLKSLLSRAEERFADVCWTTASSDDDHPDESDIEEIANGSIIDKGSDHGGGRSSVLGSDRGFSTSSKPPLATGDSIIWAHKAILYARAPNTFQARYLQLRTPAAQLSQLGSTASLVSLPTILSRSSAGQPSDPVSPNPSFARTHASSSNRLRKSVRGSAPPSSFSMKKLSPRRSLSRVRSRGKGTATESDTEDGVSITSGIMTSDSEPEFLSLVRTSSDSRAGTRPLSLVSTTPSLGRTASFVSDASSLSRDSDARSFTSTTSTIRPPMSLNGVSQTFFEATLEYLYTAEESMVDTFEFLYEDKFASDLVDGLNGPEEKVEKLRRDFTFMWRSKLYSDVKIVLNDGDGAATCGEASAGKVHGGAGSKILDIPDANTSTVSLSITVDTEMDSGDDDDEVTSFSCHRMILASRSPYFAALLLSPYSDSSASTLSLPSPPFTPASLHFTLGFLYTGTLFFSNRTFDLTTAFQLWRSGAYLQVDTLQSLVSALIAQDFCHDFDCPTPCRKCLKRVPRVLAFASSPDVADKHLAMSARRAVSGEHFGGYWAKEVGNLDPGLRSGLVSDVLARAESEPSTMIAILRQLSIVGRRIDIERSSRWVDNLRWMCETIEARLTPLLETNLDKVVGSQEWQGLVEGVGFSGDILQKSLVMLVDGLNESRAAKVYQTLVGHVLLKEEGAPTGEARQSIEDARSGILRYLKRRWVGVRAQSGFNGLEKWCLKELSDELDVPVEDLIYKDLAEATEPPKSKAGLRSVSTTATSAVARAGPARRTGSMPSQATSRSASSVGPSRLRKSSTSSVASSLSSVRTRTLSSSSVKSRTLSMSRSSDRLSQSSSADTSTSHGGADEEREAGPINLRAAVLNRNAARTSAVNGHSSSLNGPPSSSTKVASVSARTSSLNDSATARAVPSQRSSPGPCSGKPAGTNSGPSTASRSRTPSRASSAALSAPSAASLATSNVASVKRHPSEAAKGSETERNKATGASSTRTSSLQSVRSDVSSSTASNSKKLAAGKPGPVIGPRSSSRASTASSVSTNIKVSSIAEPTKEVSALAPPAKPIKRIASSEEAPDPASSTDTSSSSARALTPSTSKTSSLRGTKSAASLRTPLKSASQSSLRSAAAMAPSGSKKTKAPPPPPLPSASPSNARSSSSTGTRSRTSSSTASQALKTPTRPTAAAPAHDQTTPKKHAYLRATPREDGNTPIAARARTSSVTSQATPRASKTKLATKTAGPEKMSENDKASIRKRTNSDSSVLSAKSLKAIPNKKKAEDVPPLPILSRKAALLAQGGPRAGSRDLQDSATCAENPSSLDSISKKGDGGFDGRLNDAESLSTEFGQAPDSKTTAQVEERSEAEFASEADSKPFVPGTSLSQGIPCIVSPRDPVSGKKYSRFKAVVKYIGPLSGYRGDWIGVEIPLPIPISLEDGISEQRVRLQAVRRDRDELASNYSMEEFCPGGLNDGSIDGLRYFNLSIGKFTEGQGGSTDGAGIIGRGGKRMEYPERPERLARRKRINMILNGASSELVAPSSLSIPMFSGASSASWSMESPSLMSVISSPTDSYFSGYSSGGGFGARGGGRSSAIDGLVRDIENTSIHGIPSGRITPRLMTSSDYLDGRRTPLMERRSFSSKSNSSDTGTSATREAHELEESEEKSKGLFIRPSDVLWVVSSD